MTRILLLGCTLAMMAGCATVENNTSSTIIVNGRETELRKRTYTVNGELRETYSVRARNGSYQQCDPSSPGSCERAARKTRGKNR